MIEKWRLHFLFFALMNRSSMFVCILSLQLGLPSKINTAAERISIQKIIHKDALEGEVHAVEVSLHLDEL